MSISASSALARPGSRSRPALRSWAPRSCCARRTRWAATASITAACRRRRCSPPRTRRRACVEAHRFGVTTQSAADRFRRGARACAWRHRRDRADDSVERFTGLGVRVISAGARSWRATRSARATSRCARGVSSSPPARRPARRPSRASTRSRISPTRRCSISMSCPRASHRHRRRADRLRAGAGLRAAGRAGDAARSREPAAARTIRNWPISCGGACIGDGVEIIEGVKVAAVDRQSPAHSRFAGGAGQAGSPARICWSPPAASVNVDGLNLEAAGVRYSPKGIERRCAAAHHEQEDLRHGRCRRRAAIHPCRGLSRRHRHPQRAVPAAGEGRLPGAALGHLHRARAAPMSA